MIEFPPQISQEEYLKVLLTDPLEKLKAIIEKTMISIVIGLM